MVTRRLATNRSIRSVESVITRIIDRIERSLLCSGDVNRSTTASGFQLAHKVHTFSVDTIVVTNYCYLANGVIIFCTN